MGSNSSVGWCRFCNCTSTKRAGWSSLDPAALFFFLYALTVARKWLPSATVKISGFDDSALSHTTAYRLRHGSLQPWPRRAPLTSLNILASAEWCPEMLPPPHDGLLEAFDEDDGVGQFQRHVGTFKQGGMRRRCSPQ